MVLMMRKNTPYIASDSTTKASTMEGTRLPDIRELLLIIRERFWIGLAVAIVVLLASWFHTIRQTPYYRSRATLVVEAQVPPMLNFQNAVAFNIHNLEYFNTHLQALHSRAIMEQAILAAGLTNNSAFLPDAVTLGQKAHAALRYVSIEPVERSRMIHITVQHPDPAIAVDLANAVATAYRQQDLDNRMQASMEAVDWLRQRADEYRAKVEKGLAALQQYRESTQSVSLEEDQNIVIEKLKDLNSALTQAQTERIKLGSLRNQVAERLAKSEDYIKVATLLDDNSVRDALQRYQNDTSLLDQLAQRYRPEHPDYQAAEEAVVVSRRHFERVFTQAGMALQRRYDLAVDREKQLKKALEEQERQAFDLDRKLVQYDELRRNVEAEQDLYQTVIARMKEASLGGTVPTDLIRIAEEARPASRPAYPNRQRMLVRGGVMGLGAGLGLILILYYTDHRFRRYEDVERSLGVSVLAALPVIPGRNVRERGLVAHQQPTGEVAEAFRTMRAVMEINPSVENAKVLLVTSAHPAEGKSIVALNLAISYAQDNRRTLLIGADLRRPSINAIFTDHQDQDGLSYVLSGRKDWRESLQSSNIPNLDLLLCGTRENRPAELLGNGKLQSILVEMRSLYDRIVIDAPPVLGISDTLILLKQADGVLFVVRYGVTHSMGATHAIKRIRDSGTPCVGAVMNAADLRSLAYSYYYRQYGGYTR